MNTEQNISEVVFATLSSFFSTIRFLSYNEFLFQSETTFRVPLHVCWTVPNLDTMDIHRYDRGVFWNPKTIQQFPPYSDHLHEESPCNQQHSQHSSKHLQHARLSFWRNLYRIVEKKEERVQQILLHLYSVRCSYH